MAKGADAGALPLSAHSLLAHDVDVSVLEIELLFLAHTFRFVKPPEAELRLLLTEAHPDYLKQKKKLEAKNYTK